MIPRGTENMFATTVMARERAAAGRHGAELTVVVSARHEDLGEGSAIIRSAQHMCALREGIP